MEKDQKITNGSSWHSLEESTIYIKLDTTDNGLSAEEAAHRLEQYGENKLPVSKGASLIQIILHQILNPLIFILIAAAAASIAIGEGKDAIFIFLVIFINSTLGTYQEYNAEKSAEGLQSLLQIKARIKRKGKESEIASEKVVPGDVVLLESGMKIPADIRLMNTSNLEIDESFLTGESLTAKKQVGIFNEATGVAERTNMAFAGSTVIKGRGWGVVVSTGMDTQVGKISQDITESLSAKPPLVQRMERFIKQISLFILAISLALTVVLWLQGMELTAIFFFVVALAVSVIPEGLPVALTVALSIATKRMAKRNVIVRKLNAVESLGSCTVIASDKTGTLTVNEQTAKMIVLPDGTLFNISGEGYNGIGKVTNPDNPTDQITYSYHNALEQLCTISIFANEGSLTQENNQWTHFGDAMDVALLGLSHKLGLNPETVKPQDNRINSIPYESERKFSAAFYHSNNEITIGVKGAVETVLEFCQNIEKEKILLQAEEMAKDGYRVLAFASGEFSGDTNKDYFDNRDISALTFYGLVGFIDPLRPEAKTSVEECKQAGIKVIMITGDHPFTAGTIARELAIADKNTTVVTGKTLSEAGDPEGDSYEKLVMSSTVFARVSPAQKLEIVDVLIRQGEFVAVTGDGVNDAPAMKRANIGVAMGSGTDVAKEVGSMIVVDDNFSSIVAGVEEGRFAYDNVRKVIYLLISTGAAEFVIFIASIAVGLPLPLLAVQLLWLNLVTNGIQDIGLAFEAGESGAMNRPPRKPTERIFNALMIKQSLVSSAVMGGITFALWYWLNKYTDMNEVHARNMVLLLMVFMQNLHVLSCRSERTSAFKIPLKRNIVLVFGILAAQGIHVLSMHLPFMQKILRIEPITFEEWLSILVLAIPLIVAMEIFKLFIKKD